MNMVREILGVGKSKSLGVARGVVNNITQTIQSIQQRKLKIIQDIKLSWDCRSAHPQYSTTDYISRNNPEEVIGGAIFNC
jgi:cell division protein FtsA